MQEFKDDGNLNPGIHKYTFAKFEKQFVLDFVASETRRNIYKNFIKWFKQLLKILVPKYMWLNGSFLTKKVNPNDLDLVVFYCPEDISASVARELNSFIHESAKQFLCDAYLCLSLRHLSEAQKSQLGNSKIMETYWMGQFGFDRNRIPKGIIEITENEIQTFKGRIINDFAARRD